MSLLPDSDTGEVEVEVVLALPEKQYIHTLRVLPGISARMVVEEAVAQGLIPTLSGLNPSCMPLGVYGQRIEDDFIVQSGDRVEIYRPLYQDPMDLRRKKAKQSEG